MSVYRGSAFLSAVTSASFWAYWVGLDSMSWRTSRNNLAQKITNSFLGYVKTKKPTKFPLQSRIDPRPAEAFYRIIFVWPKWQYNDDHQWSLHQINDQWPVHWVHAVQCRLMTSAPQTWPLMSSAPQSWPLMASAPQSWPVMTSAPQWWPLMTSAPKRPPR